MSFFARLLGRHGENGCGKGLLPNNSNKRQQPCSPPSGSFSPEFAAGRPAAAAPVPVKLQNGTALQQQQQQQQQQRSSIDSDEDDCTIRVPGSLGCSGDRHRSNSLARRRAAIDISPRAVQRLSDKVALLDAGVLEVDGGGVTHMELEALYTDMQLIHRGRSSMVYRAREVRSGRRVILKAYDCHTLANSARKQALERHVLTLRAAQASCGPQGSLVLLERVVENPDGTYLVVQACNGGTLIEAIANHGGKLPERQVAMKVAVPLLQALKQLHGAGIVHRDIKPEHLMIHNGCLKIGDFGSAGCASAAAAALASNLQKQALVSLSAAKHQQHQVQQQQQQQQVDGQQADQQLVDQQQLIQELQQLQHQQLACQAGCTADAAVTGSCALQDVEQQHQRASDHSAARFGMVGDVVSGHLTPSLAGRLSVAAVRDAMNFRIGSIEYMAPEMLNKPTAAEVFHLVIAQGIDEEDLPKYDDKVDVWSLGVVLYEALAGVQPFLADSAADMLTVIGNKLAKRLDADQQQQQHHHHHHRRSPWPIRQQQELPAFIARLQVGADAKDFLASCLTWDPAQRPGACDLLSHPWLMRMQDEAAAVAISRANSRRISMQASRQRTRASLEAAAAAAAAVPVDVARSKLLQPAGDAEEQVSLVDPVVASMLEEHALLDSPYTRQTSLDLMAVGLERSQTAEQLEVGVRNVLRTHTQRIESRPLHAHVHAA